jgi:hypothetical protein
VRGFAYRNQDLALIKDTQLGESWNFQLRAEFFNVWNWHIFNSRASIFDRDGRPAFNNNLASGDFGKWAGTVTDPRTVQLAVRFEF